MNQLDIFLGGAVLLFALSGLFGGAVKRVLQVAALVIAFRESWHLTPYLQQVFGATEGEQLGGWMVLLPLLSFALVYILIRVVGGWFASLTKGTFLGVLDRVVGLVLGLLVGGWRHSMDPVSASMIASHSCLRAHARAPISTRD